MQRTKSLDKVLTRTKSNSSTISSLGEYGYPRGHFGHLSEEQLTALIEFKELLAEKKLYTPETDGKPASHEDVTLLRFLRARRFVPKDAVGQFKDTEEWRELNEIENLAWNIDVDQYEETRRLYPQWTGRRDKRGLPVYVFEVAPLNSKTMSAYAKSSAKTTVLNSKNTDSKGTSQVPPKMHRLFALYENLLTFIMPLCTNMRDRSTPETPISQANNIVDISRVGLKQFWNLRSHMQDASVLATAHYPETLDRIFIVGAPAFFPTVWGWIKRWFDPITTSKIFILTEASAFKTLSSFIDPENIPEKYGGKLPYKFGDLPILDDTFTSQMTWVNAEAGAKNWPKGPMKWKDNGDGTWDFMAVGSVDGKERREAIAKFRPDLQSLPPPVEPASTAAPATAETGLEKDVEKLAVEEKPKAAEASTNGQPAKAATNGAPKESEQASPAATGEVLSEKKVEAQPVVESEPVKATA